MDPKLINPIVIQFDLDPEVIERVIRSQFEFTMNTMEQGNFESVHLHKWGKYAVKPNRVKQINREEFDWIGKEKKI